jgi:hypothetical protein
MITEQEKKNFKQYPSILHLLDVINNRCTRSYILSTINEYTRCLNKIDAMLIDKDFKIYLLNLIKKDYQGRIIYSTVPTEHQSKLNNYFMVRWEIELSIEE